MRPTVFSAGLLLQFLRENRIATLPQLKQLLGTEANITVFRKLKELSYRSSYSHRGSFYTLDEIAAFDELRAAIVLFASVLDEQQRRLYAGVESLQLGGDRQIADLLHLDPHTVAKGRRQLLAQDVKVGRVRAVGGGRKPVEKKRPQ